MDGTSGAPGEPGPEGKQGPEGVTGLSAEKIATLDVVLPHIKYVAAGIGGKLMIQFSDANLQIVSGAGKTNSNKRRGQPGLGLRRSQLLGE